MMKFETEVRPMCGVSVVWLSKRVAVKTDHVTGRLAVFVDGRAVVRRGNVGLWEWFSTLVTRPIVYEDETGRHELYDIDL